MIEVAKAGCNDGMIFHFYEMFDLTSWWKSSVMCKLSAIK
jgi:hypothetical protein